MAPENDKYSTSGAIASANYQPAKVIDVGKQARVSAMRQQGRTVTTSARSGSVELRYAPHPPKVTDINTSS